MQLSLKYPSQIFKSKPGKHSIFQYFPFNYSSSTFATTASIFAVFIVIFGALPAQSYNDEKGILKWNPYWFTNNFRYSAPSAFYVSPSRIGTPYKRLSDTMWNSGGSSFTGGNTGGIGGIYKWSPVYFSGGTAPTQASYGGGGNMYSSNRPRWSLSDYGGSRFLTRYYGGNSYAPSITKDSGAGIDLANGNNDLSALLGDEIMNNGLGLDNDAVDVLNGEGMDVSDKKN